MRKKNKNEEQQEHQIMERTEHTSPDLKKGNINLNFNINNIY